MVPTDEDGSAKASRLRRFWLRFFVAAGANLLCVAVAAATTGPVLQIGGLLVFITGIPLLRASTRLLDHYEGHVAAATSAGGRLRYAAFLVLIIWWVGEWYLRGGMPEKTLKLLVFLSLFVNFWTVFGVLLLRDRSRTDDVRKENKADAP